MNLEYTFRRLSSILRVKRMTAQCSVSGCFGFWESLGSLITGVSLGHKFPDTDNWLCCINATRSFSWKINYLLVVLMNCTEHLTPWTVICKGTQYLIKAENRVVWLFTKQEHPLAMPPNVGGICRLTVPIPAFVFLYNKRHDFSHGN